MSIAKELLNSDLPNKKIVSRAAKAEPIENRFKGAHILTFSDGSRLLMKKGTQGAYFCLICDEERLS